MNKYEKLTADLKEAYVEALKAKWWNCKLR